MSTEVPQVWLDRIERLLAGGGRRLLGIAGTPGAGKSSLAAALAHALGPKAALVPMDGFHLANSELERLGRAKRKGAPDTFDALGCADLLRRLRNPVEGETLYAPEFRREIEEAVAGAIAVSAKTPLLIVEGNYLLLEEPPWHAIRPLLDECWYVEIGREARIARLIARHRHYGRSEKAAREWVLNSDERNAERIERSRDRADFVLQWPPSAE